MMKKIKKKHYNFIRQSVYCSPEPIDDTRKFFSEHETK